MSVQYQFHVQGWSCAGCANKTRNHVQQQSESASVEANFATNQLSVSTPDDSVKPAQIAGWIESLGYQVTLAGNDQQQRHAQLLQQDIAAKKQFRRELMLVSMALLLSLPLVSTMIGMFAGFFSEQSVGVGWHLSPWVEWLLATPVQFIVGARYYRGAWLSLKNNTANMDSLVALGTSAAYFYSLYLWLSLGSAAMGQLYFEASAVVITLVSLGKLLETKAKHNTTEAIRELMALQPLLARVIRNGEEQQLAVEQILLGDRIKVLPGEQIPVDGRVLVGESETNEALLTGESTPQQKLIGSQVIAGSVNGSGLLELETTAVGEDTSLNQVIALVERAQQGKAPIQALVDKISAWFVPSVLVIAGLTLLGQFYWQGELAPALMAAVAVLVVACPCALGLATPAAIVTGTGVAARHGILIRDISALQQAAGLTRVVFDKTGTLTTGRPEVCQFYLLSAEEPENRVLQHLLPLQKNSEHPLARAIVEYAEQYDLALLPVKEFQVFPGGGVSAKVDGARVVSGNLNFLREQGVAIAEELENQFQGPYSLVWVAMNGQLTALIELHDPLRNTSRQAIESLHDKALGAGILSGDNPAMVKAVADQLELDDYLAGLKPADKLNAIEAQQRRGERVAMVGDGLNDAPALAQADVGIAMGSGTQVAMASAGITLMRSDPRLVVDAIGLSKATWRTIKQNLFWAFIFNTLGIPLAALGYLSPALAGAAMAASSLCVLSNALLLKRWRPMSLQPGSVQR